MLFRSGQTEQVTVYKIIAKDSVEERILTLQQQKQGLSDQIISKDGVSMAEMTREDMLNLIDELSITGS